MTHTNQSKTDIKQKSFIERSKKIHNNKYDYSKVVYVKAKQKVIIVCPIHGAFEQIPTSHILHHGCPKCGTISANKKRTKSKQLFLEKAKKIHNNKYDYSKVVYKTTKVKVVITCPIHGDFLQKPALHIKKHGCPKCAHEKTSLLYTSTQKSFIEKANKVHGNKYDYSLVNYIKSIIKVKIVCKIHGIFEQAPSAHLSGQNCPECTLIKLASKNRKSITQVQSELVSKYPDYLFPYIEKEYKNNKTNLTVICKKHGTSQRSFNDLLRKNFACAKCGIEKRAKESKLSVTEIINRANYCHNNKYTYPYLKDEYISCDIPVTITCKKHGDFQQRIANHIFNKSGCPKCTSYAKISKGEKELLEWLSQYTNVESSNRSILNGKEIDLYLPDYNVGIEYNGNYFHSEQNHVLKNYHLNKTKLAEEKGVYLLQFWETECLWQMPIVKSIILSSIGKSPKIIFARKLQVRNVTTKEARYFCMQNHIHGFRGGNQYIGLYKDTVLLSLLIISSNGEVVRFVNKIYYNIPGAFSRLLSYAKNVKFSFVDRRLFTGTSYTKCGFIFERNTKPNYFYCHKNTRKPESRIKYQKHKLKKLLPLFDPELTEVQNMVNNGFFRIFDCGNKYFTYVKK